MTAAHSTLTDPRSHRGWHIDDAVVRLREHGADRVYRFPDPPRPFRMGTASELCLFDSTGTVSREHVEAVPVETDRALVWELRDLHSKNGLRFDGKPRSGCWLRPGIEVSLGSLRLVAESEQLMRLLALLRRFLGWAPERQWHVDQAASGLRDWASQRAELVVVGDGDLTPVVRRLHRLVVGESVPWTAYGPNGGDAGAVVQAAVDGTLCAQVERREAALSVVERWRDRDPLDRPQLILCAADQVVVSTILGTLGGPVVVIRVPSPQTRAGEQVQIVQAYADEIAQVLRLARSGLTLRDVEQLGTLTFQSLEDIEDAALRLVLVRTFDVDGAAQRLGRDPSSVRVWMKRRGLEV